MIGTTILQYKIIERIGAGGMGEVFLAEDTELKRRVAFKFLPPGYAYDADVLKRFKREAQAAAALNHPNIITIHNVGVHQGRPYIVMEHVEGQPLSALIEGGSLSLARALDIASQICDGLSKSHQADIVHRDIKPDNILIDPDGRVRILDFGLAKLRGVTQLTQEDSTVGTINYMSPEQSRGEEVDHRSDIFSFGVVLYEMIAGQRPFQGDHRAAVLYGIANLDAQPLRRYNNDATDGLERIVAKALAKDCSERYQSTADLLADLKREQREADVTGANKSRHTGGSVPRAASAGDKRRRVRLALGIFLPVAIALALLFKPFSMNVTTDSPAMAQDNSLAIMYFENLADPDDEKRLGEIITSLLITDLSNACGLRVVSSQRLYDILKNLDKEGAKTLDQSTASQVARKANARLMLLGSVLQEKPALVIASQVVDVASGDVVHSQRVSGRVGAGVFDMVDELSLSVRQDLELMDESPQDQHPRVSDVTTASEEAYGYYLEGWEFLQENFKREAITSFRRAIEYDSTFAMAYYRLAKPSLFMISAAERTSYINAAYRHIDRASDKDKMYIRGLHAIYHFKQGDALAYYRELLKEYPDEKDASFSLGNVYWYVFAEPDSAEKYSLRAVELDPKFGLGYNSLAYFYADRGDFERAVSAIDKYIEAEPDTPNAYDSRGEILARFGRTDEAIESFEEAVDREPQFITSLVSIGHVHLLRQEPVKAEVYYRRGGEVSGPFTEGLFGLSMALIPAHSGQFRVALSQLERILADNRDRPTATLAYTQGLGMKSYIHLHLGEFDQAITLSEERRRAMREAGELPTGWDDIHIEILARAGKLEEAETTVNAIPPEEIFKVGRPFRSGFWIARGVIAFERGDYAAAVEFFTEAAKFEYSFFSTYYLGRALLEAGRVAEAVIHLEHGLLDHSWDHAMDPINSTLIHYYAGVAYEKSGWTDKAIDQYEIFLGIWKDADHGLPQLADARGRLSSLRRDAVDGSRR